MSYIQQHPGAFSSELVDIFVGGHRFNTLKRSRFHHPNQPPFASNRHSVTTWRPSRMWTMLTWRPLFCGEIVSDGWFSYSHRIHVYGMCSYLYLFFAVYTPYMDPFGIVRLHPPTRR